MSTKSSTSISFFFFLSNGQNKHLSLFKEIKWNQKISTFDLLKLEKTKQRDFLLKIWSTLDYLTISLFEHHQLNVWPPSLCTIENGIGFFQNQCFFSFVRYAHVCLCVHPWPECRACAGMLMPSSFVICADGRVWWCIFMKLLSWNMLTTPMKWRDLNLREADRVERYCRFSLSSHFVSFQFFPKSYFTHVLYCCSLMFCSCNRHQSWVLWQSATPACYHRSKKSPCEQVTQSSFASWNLL